MAKHYILVNVEQPKSTESFEQQQAWLMLNSKTRQSEPAGSCLQQGVWLVEREAGLPFVSSILAGAQDRGLKANYRFLSEE